MAAAAETSATRGRRVSWRKINTWLGHVVFGLPALLAVPALVATTARFGWLETLTAAVPAAAWACIPLLLWIFYLRRRRGRRLAWALLLVIAVVVLALSPIFFWAAPAVLVLILEAARGVLTGVRDPATSRKRFSVPSLLQRLRRRPRPTKDLVVRKPSALDGPAR